VGAARGRPGADRRTGLFVASEFALVNLDRHELEKRRDAGETGLAPVIGVLVGVLLATVFSMVVGELVPKNFALAVPRQTAKLVVPFQVGFTAVFRPLVNC